MQMLKQDKWKTLSSEYLFNRPWLTVRRDSYELPDGRIVPEYYILEYPDWVNTLAITKDRKFVFVSQYRPGLKRNDYELCAGVSEKSFQEFTAEQGYELEESFPADRSTLRQLTKFAGSGGGLTINFDAMLLGERVFWDPATDTLTIKGTPPNLRDQLQRRTSGGN